MKQSAAIVLSVYLGLFVVEAVVALLDATLVLVLDLHLLMPVRGLMSSLVFPATVLIYGLMALTPMIPKRFLMPVTLFSPVGVLACIPVMIFHYHWLAGCDWVFAFCQLVLGLAVLFWAQGGFKLRWPLLAEETLGERRFSWLNLGAFTAVNALVLLPAAAIYLAFCASLAVAHFTDDFLSLDSKGLTASAKTFVREDGKTIQLIPMMHIGEASFYDQISKSIPTGAIVLKEGVTDEKKLLTQHLSYKRAATSLGLVEQRDEFEPAEGRVLRADIDVSEFSASTIELLNHVARVHAQGFSAPLLLEVQKFESPDVIERFVEDVLSKRNAHLLREIEAALKEADHVVVPWGAAHMPGVAKGILDAGFKHDRTREYAVVKFRSAR